MTDPQNDKPPALLRMAIRLYNSGYHAGHHDTVETGYVDIFSCDIENYHEDEAREIVRDFLESNLTDQDVRDLQTIFDDASLASAETHDLFAWDIDDDTYVILDKSGQQKMLMTRKPGNRWKLYTLIDSDQYRSDLMERHGVSHANAQSSQPE